jgi:hypothetical protein
MFEDLTQKAYDAKLIPRPTTLALSKFSLKFFAEMWLQQKAAQTRFEQEQLQRQGSPVKEVRRYSSIKYLREIIMEDSSTAYELEMD